MKRSRRKEWKTRSLFSGFLWLWLVQPKNGRSGHKRPHSCDIVSKISNKGAARRGGRQSCPIKQCGRLWHWQWAPETISSRVTMVTGPGTPLACMQISLLGLEGSFRTGRNSDAFFVFFVSDYAERHCWHCVVTL